MFHPDGPSFAELARQALSSTDSGYDSLAPKFDVTPFRTPGNILEAVSRYVSSTLNPRRALDLGSGTGAVAEHFASFVPVVGLDRSEGMLLVAVGHDPKSLVVRGDALKPPFGPSFDLVTCFGAFGHFLLEEHGALVAAIRACLVPGGHFVCVAAPKPGPLSAGYWACRAANAVMRARNALWSPPFVMYYLTFDLETAIKALEAGGFEVAVRDIGLDPHRLVDASLQSRYQRPEIGGEIGGHNT